MKRRGVLLLAYPFKVGFQDYHDEFFFFEQLQKVIPQPLVSEEVGFDENWQDKGYAGPYVFELRAE